MPQFKKGNMFEDYPKMGVCYFATTCAVIKKWTGQLVMGKGNALELAKREPWLPGRLGKDIGAEMLTGTNVRPTFLEKPNNESYYGRIYKMTDYWVGAFQTKYDWKDQSSMKLIEGAAKRLTDIAKTFPEVQFYLPFPGIGLGGLRREDVLPLLQDLPDNVVIWER